MTTPDPTPAATIPELVAGPWQAERVPDGWVWLPGFGLCEDVPTAARLCLIFTSDELPEPPGLMPYIEQQRAALAGLVEGVSVLGTRTLDTTGYDEAELIGLILNRNTAQEVWQEQIYLRLGRQVGVITASGPASQRDRLRDGLSLAMQVAAFCV